MRVGIVGFAGSGKSTLFELLTGTRPDPGKTHAGQVGVATLSDPRLDFLAALHKPKKVTPATVEFLDTPGLMAGSHADNPQRLALIREGDALLDRLERIRGGDPAAQLAAFRDELLFADLSVVTSRAERLEASVKKARPDREQSLKELAIIKVVQAALEEGKPVATLDLSADDKKPLRSFGLLTDKPHVALLNTIQGQDVSDALRALAPEALAIDAKLELELSQLEPDERAAFMTDLGVQRAGPRSDHPPGLRRGRHHHVLHGRRARGTRLEPRARGNRRRGRRQDPHRHRQGLHPRRGHRIRRAPRGRLPQRGQSQAPATARRQGIHRQGRRRHLLPQRALSADTVRSHRDRRPEHHPGGQWRVPSR